MEPQLREILIYWDNEQEIDLRLLEEKLSRRYFPQMEGCFKIYTILQRNGN